jgi:membrane associated rhomboid family serine protease
VPTCPDHARELVVVGATGERTCPFCRGALLDPGAFSLLKGNAPLAPETREDAPCFVKVRLCPDCAVPMTPWRLAQLEGWVEKCPRCEAAWVEQTDRRTLENLATRAKKQQAWKSFSPQERADIARELAASEAPPADSLVTDLSAGETVKAVVGLPVVSGATGEEPPLVTIALTLVIACFFAMGLVDEKGWGFEALAWQPRNGLSIGLFTAMWAHGGWLHVLGNLAFLWTFGDAVERRGHHGLLLGTFLATGLVTTFLQGFASTSDTFIGGASGAIFAVMGVAAVFQRGARMKLMLPMMRLTGLALNVPLWAGVFVFFMLQVTQWAAGEPGVAWFAHVSGLLLGVTIGLAARRASS